MSADNLGRVGRHFAFYFQVVHRQHVEYGVARNLSRPALPHNPKAPYRQACTRTLAKMVCLLFSHSQSDSVMKNWLRDRRAHRSGPLCVSPHACMQDDSGSPSIRILCPGVGHSDDASAVTPAVSAHTAKAVTGGGGIWVCRRARSGGVAP